MTRWWLVPLCFWMSSYRRGEAVDFFSQRPFSIELSTFYVPLIQSASLLIFLPMNLTRQAEATKYEFYEQRSGIPIVVKGQGSSAFCYVIFEGVMRRSREGSTLYSKFLVDHLRVRVSMRLSSICVCVWP